MLHIKRFIWSTLKPALCYGMYKSLSDFYKAPSIINLQRFWASARGKEVDYMHRRGRNKLKKSKVLPIQETSRVPLLSIIIFTLFLVRHPR